MRNATALAGEVYDTFLSEVVESCAIRDRVGSPLDERKRKDVAADRAIDSRVVRLMAISGKGGYHTDPLLRERYASSINVTLLDHLLSVVRGALTFTVQDVLASNPDANREALRADLRVVAAIAFVHDLDKDLGLARDTALPLDAVQERWTRYGLDSFVGDSHALTADQVRFLIEQAEVTQAHRSPPVTYPPRRFSHYMAYVALADKLDGLWLSEGADAVLARLHSDETLSISLLRSWEVVDLYDPHHPFLMDELQRFLSGCCQDIPPLLELHQDGRLVMLVPADDAAKIRACALRQLLAFLAKKLFGLRVNVSNRGVPELLDVPPTHDDLSDYVSTGLPARTLSDLFRVKADCANAVLTGKLDALLGDVDLAPRWLQASTQTISPYPNPLELSEVGQGLLRKAAHLALLLNHKSAAGLPDYPAREEAVLRVAALERPAWLTEIGDAASRRIFTALWLSRASVDDSELHERVWGDNGLLKIWLEGPEGGQGLRETIAGTGASRLAAVEEHFHKRLFGRPTLVQAGLTNRCLFTDLPVASNGTFKEADRLYEVKKSAFSGRDGRLEDVTSARGETHIGPVSYVEHRLRSRVHADAKRRPDGIPSLLSAPAVTGLFGSLTLKAEQSFSALSIYDLSREQLTKGTVYRGADVYRHRYRIARYERVPDRLKDQVLQLRLMLQAARRIGRPLHVFRGLPTPEKAFFYFDAMPRRLSDLIGGNRLRLEQIPEALERLQVAELLLDANGLGFETFDRYARAETRLGAVCLAWGHVHDEARRTNKRDHRSVLLRREFDQLERDSAMSDAEAPLVRFGRAAARIQRQPFHSAAANEEMMVFNLSLDAAIGAWRLGQTDPESLAMAVAGELDTNFRRRKDKIAAKENRPGETLQEAYVDIARQFIAEVWDGVLKGRPPAQSKRRILASIYRMAFLTTPRTKKDAEQVFTPATEQPE